MIDDATTCDSGVHCPAVHVLTVGDRGSCFRLQQISKNDKTCKDGRMTVRLLMKYSDKEKPQEFWEFVYHLPTEYINP
ncbi:hypothetical protein MUK42_14678 [Musa troglodytarum]|uniref:Uncharacterized protein n=1 Tax=Musa troglodytarum TaxID=320322 RepID=A0A9E7HT13_9LILI|nr:hypothetical protein MUK42_14678 [Musa troglodytarum]